jgi:hypothetical protein
MRAVLFSYLTAILTQRAAMTSPATAAPCAEGEWGVAFDGHYTRKAEAKSRTPAPSD